MPKRIYILGISAFYHDSAAVLLCDGEIVAAAQEERFTRKKHDDGFPQRAIDFCLNYGGITAAELDYVAFYEKPFLKFERLLESYLASAPRGFASFVKAMPVWIKSKIWIKDQIKKSLSFSGPILFPEHHESHAASAFYPSPFERAAFLTVDGVGEWTTASYGVGGQNRIKLLADIRFPHSLGLLYSAFTYFTGFKVNSAEYKVMGLAPYGEPVYKALILEKLIDLKPDGSFALNMEYFDYLAGLTMTNRKFERLFGEAPRRPESPLRQLDLDLAASIQSVTEEVMLKIAAHVRSETAEENLCLAGGVALNCVANGKLARGGLFQNLWIQPAAGDAGGALGAALVVWHQYLGHPRRPDRTQDSQKGSFLGPEYTDEEIQKFLSENGIKHQKLEERQLLDKTAELLASGAVVGWFSGRMEFGPRALGARSILGDARSPDMQKKMNLKIKFRESFRPFAPAVLEEKCSEYFELSAPSPYMLLVANVTANHRKTFDDGVNRQGLEKLNALRSDIPAVTHVDFSARIQTVSAKTNPRFHALLRRFDEKFGCPVLVNTSFNVRGEPIVCTPQDAYRCFSRTGMDYLVLGNCLLDAAAKDKTETQDRIGQFPLD